MGKRSFAERQQEQQRRALRRQITAIELATGMAFVDRAKIQELMDNQRMLAAVVRQLGRVRVTEEELAALKESDRLTARRDGSSMTITFVAGETEPEAPAAGEDLDELEPEPEPDPEAS